MKSRLIEVAGVGLLVAFASSARLLKARSTGRRAAGKAVGDRGQSRGRCGHAFARPVDSRQRVGGAAVRHDRRQRRGTTTAQVRTWSDGRTPQERNELNGRCTVITNPTYSARYPANAQQFCRTFTTAQAASSPPATKY